MGARGVTVEPAVGGTLRGGAGAVAGDGEEGLDRFLRRRGAALIGSINNMPVASAITGRTRTDDFLDAEMGKHDYDWLLTPPATPNFMPPAVCGNQLTPTPAATKQRVVKSASTSRPSRLSSSQQENGHSTRPMRSSSGTRPSISNTHSNSLPSNRTPNRNTTTASVTSRPSTPTRPSTHGSRSGPVPSARAPARSVNPAKTRPSLTSANNKPRPSQSSRPSTPTDQPQLPSRPSTPTRGRKPPSPSSSPATTAGRSPSAGRLLASRNTGPSSHPSSHGLRSIDSTLFSHDAPNLRTKLPEKPASAGRTRPGATLTVRASSNTQVPDNLARLQFTKSDHGPVLHEIQKSMVPGAGGRRSSKVGLAESRGFGRTISKMSLDMALKHMDIRQSIGGIRASAIFPHSIRPKNSLKSRSNHGEKPIAPITDNEKLLSGAKTCDITISANGRTAVEPMNQNSLIVKGSDLDLYGSSRYDTMLLREDSMNTKWLHSVEDKSDQSPVFDLRFEPPPEPFSQL